MAEKQGYLTKEGGGVKSWKKRWCVLKNGALHYSKSQDSGALGIIRLDTARTVGKTDYKKKKYCFEIVTPDRTYFMQAESEAERDSWIKVLTQVRDQLQNPKKESSDGTVGLKDFDLLKVIGKGSFGKVMQVRKKDTGKIYAMKVLSKKTILERQELEHTKAEKNILQKLVHPFLVNLYYSFQTPEKLYFVMDYVNGGELFFHLQKDMKFSEERVRFYSAEIALGLEYLHSCGVLYRDLKPENILLTGEGHICMTDFGISKEGLVSEDDRTATFCGTPEYLAPEILEGTGYGKPVDWWSFGTLVFEMLTGLPPFYCEDVQQMYKKIMTAKLTFQSNITPEARDLLEKLLERDPNKRLAEPAKIKAHPFFAGYDWDKLLKKEVKPPYVPPVKNEEDTSMVDPTFTDENPELSIKDESAISDQLQSNFDGFTFAQESEIAKE